MEIRIGRLINNDIVIQDPNVSRFHCTVRLNKDGSMILRDKDSLNGVFVNGNKVDVEKTITKDDMVQIGGTVFKGSDFLDKFAEIEQDMKFPSYDLRRDPDQEYEEMGEEMLKLVNHYYAKNLQSSHASNFDTYSDDILKMALDQYRRGVEDLSAVVGEVCRMSQLASQRKSDDLTRLINLRVRKVSGSGDDAVRMSVSIEMKKEAIEAAFRKLKDSVGKRLDEACNKFAEVNPVLFGTYYDMADPKSGIWEHCKRNAATETPKAWYLGERKLRFKLFEDEWTIPVHEYGRFINSSNIVAHYDRQSLPDCLDFVNGLALRLFMSMPPGQVVLNMIDADSMEGTSQHFKRLDHRVYNIVSQSNEISDVLGLHALHIGNILQNVLVGNNTNLQEYNEGKETKESYRVLIVNGFPKGLWSDTSAQLKKIMQNGIKAGVQVVILVDDDALADSDDARKVYAALAPDKMPSVEVFDFTHNTFPFGYYNEDSSQFEPCRFSTTQIQNVVNSVNKGFEVKEETVLRLSDYLPRQDEWWTSRSSSMVEIPFGMSVDKQIIGLKITQESGQNSAVVIGIPGSGKSAFLHSVILNAAVKYSPDELNMYLLDFSGVEFNTYALHHLPHARVIAPEAEREFGLSVLKELKEEGLRRMNLCRDNEVNNIVELRNRHPEIHMPRLLVIIDEFQKLFEIENDKISREANSIIHIIIQEFRKFGINLILATQKLPGAGILPKDMIANRVVFKSQPNDFSSLITMAGGQPNLNTGECIYNSESGSQFANAKVKSFFSNKRDTDMLLDVITEFSATHMTHGVETIVFRGADQPDFAQRRNIEAHRNPTVLPEETGFYLGQPIEIADYDVYAPLRCDVGDNILILGGDADVAEKMALYGALSLTQSYSDNTTQFCLFNAMRSSDPLAEMPDKWFTQMPFNTVYLKKADEMEEMLGYLKDMVDMRKADETQVMNHIYLVFFAFQFANAFDKRGHDLQSKASKLLEYVLENGPQVGISTIIQATGYESVERIGNVLKRFNHRVVLQMSESESNKLIGNAAASHLHVFNRPYTKYRALYFDNNKNNIVKFKPYK